MRRITASFGTYLFHTGRILNHMHCPPEVLNATARANTVFIVMIQLTLNREDMYTYIICTYGIVVCKVCVSNINLLTDLLRFVFVFLLENCQQHCCKINSLVRFREEIIKLLYHESCVQVYHGLS